MEGQESLPQTSTTIRGPQPLPDSSPEGSVSTLNPCLLLKIQPFLLTLTSLSPQPFLNPCLLCGPKPSLLSLNWSPAPAAFWPGLLLSSQPLGPPWPGVQLQAATGALIPLPELQVVASPGEAMSGEQRGGDVQRSPAFRPHRFSWSWLGGTSFLLCFLVLCVLPQGPQPLLPGPSEGLIYVTQQDEALRSG